RPYRDPGLEGPARDPLAGADHELTVRFEVEVDAPAKGQAALLGIVHEHPGRIAAEELQRLSRDLTEDPVQIEVRGEIAGDFVELFRLLLAAAPFRIQLGGVHRHGEALAEEVEPTHAFRWNGPPRELVVSGCDA